MHAATPLLLISLALAAPLSAQPATGVPAPSRRAAQTQPTGAAGNAALTYYNVWASLGEADMKAINELYPDSEFGKPLSQELHRIVTAHQGDIARLVKASNVKNCDFGLDYSEGFMMLMPHLGKLRTTTRLLAADARRCIAEGKLEDAADRYAAIYGVARHAGCDHVMISSLVSIAIVTVPVGDLVDHNAVALFTPAGRARLLAAVERFGGVDGFGLKPAIQCERAMAVDAAMDKYDGPDAGKRMEEELLHLVNGRDNAPTPKQRESGEKIRAMDGKALRAELVKLNAYYDAAEKVWDRADAQAQLEKLGEAADRGEYGEFGYHFLPALTNCRISQNKGRDALDKVAAAIRKADAEAARNTK